jgi:hypothetical protein
MYEAELFVTDGFANCSKTLSNFFLTRNINGTRRGRKESIEVQCLHASMRVWIAIHRIEVSTL